ncbi:lipase chaperone [Saccharothrix sp. NRRL B-16314]|uniref:lipase chaperone n=1 Tax=Saccharothrix sp. NRRL B-16314 TaxID=1463825 RepID=UPI00068E82C4|nr:lipase chaperone [Saccharothrix sp. NRRL B-16314]
MVAPIRVRALQWLLVSALAIAVVGMHHLSGHDAGHSAGMTAVVAVEPVAVECCADHVGMTEPLPAMSTASAMPMADLTPSMPEPSGHDLLHLCLAVLVAALGLGVLLRALRRSPVCDLVGAFVIRTVGRRPPLPPPRGVPAVLASLCVLRL